MHVTVACAVELEELQRTVVKNRVLGKCVLASAPFSILKGIAAVHWRKFKFGAPWTQSAGLPDPSHGFMTSVPLMPAGLDLGRAFQTARSVKQVLVACL
jgi:hypothetical protein